MSIQIKNVSKRFHDTVVLDDVSLHVKSGELIALLGPSGSGKTTLLRIIAGLEFSDSGSILLDSQEAHTKHVKERNVGFVFQHYALFKHMTVFENVAFGLKVRPRHTRPTDSQIIQKVTELLQLVHLEAFADHYPTELSGGQRQRVALVRALAVDPKVLLLDEPFGSLDAKVRKELRRWMRRLHDDIRVTSIFVTHDQEEAMEVADRVVVMNNGQVKQIGTPEEVWYHPADRFVYNFLGNYNEFDGWQDEAGNLYLDEDKISIATNRSDGHLQYNAIKIYSRPHEMLVTRGSEDKEYIRAKVRYINPTGALIKLELEGEGGKVLQVEISIDTFNALNVKKGDELYLKPKKMTVFD